MKPLPLQVHENAPTRAFEGSGARGLTRWLMAGGLAAAFFLAAPGTSAQKFKDEQLHQYLTQEFAKLNDRVDKLNDRVTAIENRLSQMEKIQAGLLAGQAQMDTLQKSSDTSLSSLRLSTQQDLFELKAGVAELKSGLTQMEHSMGSVVEAVKKINPPPPVVAQQPPTLVAPNVQAQLVGYIDTSDAANWTINLGTADGVRAGQQFHIFHLNSTDGSETEAGLAEVTDASEPHKAHIKVVSSKPDIKIDFGDIVRFQ
jgi:uncharacterized phage infection (PIP) family protein YhgE